MENRVLKYFLVVAREENITRASEILHISQPALSRQLIQLEEELGSPLLVRGKRRVTLTEAGRFLRRRAQEIIELGEKTERELRGGIDTVSGEISIGMGESTASELIAEYIREFGAIYPNVRFSYYSNNADYIKEQIEKGLLDIGVLLEPTDLSKYEFIRLPVTDRWGALIPSAWPLSAKAQITADDLRGVPITLPKRTQPIVEKWMGDAYDENCLHGTHNLMYNAAMTVAKGMCVALTIDGAVGLYHNPDFVFRPLEPEMTLTTVFVWKKFQAASQTVLKFIEYVKNSAGGGA